MASSKSSLRVRADKARKQRSRTLVCVLENPNTQENVAGVLRSIDALGVAKLYIITGAGIKIKDWESIRENGKWNSLSVSAVKWVYTKCFETTEECLAHLARKNFTNLATSPHIKGKVNLELTTPSPLHTSHHLAIWFGNEAKGLSEVALQACQACLQVPMCGIIESLNLASCAGIVLHHIAHVRKEYLKSKEKRRSQVKTIIHV